MNNYIGIDLGTTNSAICSFDGQNTKIWKSPEQNDVTPSVIFIDPRGNKYVGKRAYDVAPRNPDHAAQLFKRLMGTNTPLKLKSTDITMSPEECSAEILRVLFGYLPEEIRDTPQVGSVVTVPAAFNQMQKDATLHAAELAGIGQVALMQEPVAAIMSIVRARNTDGTFLVFDLGGGTLDIAIAEGISGRINLLTHGGIAMCGGRDFDRLIVDNIVKPWLLENFDLPKDLTVDSSYASLLRLVTWAAERAKIELSAREESVISLSEVETSVSDKSNNEIYVDLRLTRTVVDKLIEEKVHESIEAARATLSKAGLRPDDVERVVFVGGPTNYKPLRDMVAFELGIAGSAEVNPMTAVAEGAAVFAESIDWDSQSRGRKKSRDSLATRGPVDLTFNFTSRTPDTKAKIFVEIQSEPVEGTEFQVDSLDTGWTSGRMPLTTGSSIEVTLSLNGPNSFKVFVFDGDGSSISLAEDKICITRTAASIDGIPASHSIGIEVREKLGGASTIEWLVRAGDQLPKKGTTTVKAGESIKARSAGSLDFKLWEGESDEPTDNRYIGHLKITGDDFDEGVIPAGADLQCDYLMRDSGNIEFEVSIASIGGTFGTGKNFYSPQEGKLDYSSESVRVREEGERTNNEIQEIEDSLNDPRLEKARSKLQVSLELDSDEADVEKVQEAMESVHEVRKLVAQVRKENVRTIRQLKLDDIKQFFDEVVRDFARTSEATKFDNLVRTSQRSIDNRDKDFDTYLAQMREMNAAVLFRQDSFIVAQFNHMVESPHQFTDRAKFDDLVEAGRKCLQSDNIDQLREIIFHLWQIRIYSGFDLEKMLDAPNIIRS